MIHGTPRHLGKKARTVLDCVARNRCILADLIHRLFFADRTPNAATQCLRTLKEQGWVQRQRVIQTTHAVLPTAKAAKFYGLPPCYAKPLPRQPMLQNLGASLYLGLDAPKRRLLPGELLTEFSWFDPALARDVPFYFDHAENHQRLAMIRVEESNSPFRIVQKHRTKLCCWQENRHFRQLLAADSFMLVTITATKQSALKIAEQIELFPDYPTHRVMAWPTRYRNLMFTK